MSWWAVLALCASAYALKLAGVVLSERIPASALRRGGLEIVAVPVIAALIVVQTLDGGREITVDARLPAVLLAALLIWRRTPILVVVLASGGAAALLRLAT